MYVVAWVNTAIVTSDIVSVLTIVLHIYLLALVETILVLNTIIMVHRIVIIFAIPIYL